MNRDVKHLKFVLSKYKPIRDNATSASWMKQHRPSVAWLLAILSGPWNITRRQKVQAHAIEILGKRDLSQLSTREITSIAPLEWQRQYLKAARAVCKRRGKRFDAMQAKKSKRLKYIAEIVAYQQDSKVTEDNVEKHIDRCPKVVLMYVRDYLNHDCFPIDRHVRRWLQANKLPVNHAKLMNLFRGANLKARGYARAVFGAHAKNPRHAPTK